MGDKTVSVRVKFEGGQAVKAGLQEVGREGTQALQSIGTMSAQTGAKFQNAGYQISDFFVQVNGGTAPTRALAQQLPQLLQGFGLVGVAASVLIAALPGLWSMFSNGSGSAKELEDSVQSLSDALRNYQEAVSAANVSPGKLFDDFGGQAAKAKEVLEIQRQIAAAQAENALTQASGSLTTLFGNPADLDLTLRKIAEVKAEIASASTDPSLRATFDFDRATRQLEFYNKVLRNLFSGIGDQIGVELDGAEAQIAALAQSILQLDRADGASAQAAAMASLRENLIGAVAAGGEMNDEVLALLDGLTDSELAALRLSLVDLATPIGSGADEADRLANNLARAAAVGPGKLARQGDDGRGGQGEQRRSAAEYNSSVIMERLFPKTGSGGAGGGGGGADPDIARARALTEGLRTETEKYAASLEEVNRLKEKGLITDETYARQLDKLKTGLGETSDLAKKAAGAIRTAFDGLFDDPKQALKDLAKQLAMMALYMQLAKSFPGAFGPNGAVPLIPGFASGGRHRGGLRIVGENGPELEATGPSTIYPNDMLRRMSGGGGGGTKVEVHNYGSGEVTTTERKGPNGERIIRLMVGKDLASGQHDVALRSRFGQRPAPVKR